MDIGLDVTREVVAVVLAAGTEVSALLPTEVIAVVDSKRPGMCAQDCHKDSKKVQELH
jgi:hypothetical protein